MLVGHPTGNPNSHHAALAHFEAGRLEAFCVPWMPTAVELDLLRSIPGLRKYVSRLERRRFAPLASAPLIQGRMGEWGRMARRVLGTKGSDERVSYEANDWLMRTMCVACRAPSVTAVHAYEDCAGWQFDEARRLGKACIYDMPTAYYEARQKTIEALVRRFAEWFPGGPAAVSRYVRHAQKKREMELADLVLVPSTFARDAIRGFMDKQIEVAAYGVDAAFWHEPLERPAGLELVFLYAGQCAVQKGIPLLLDAWRAAGLKNAKLILAGSWHLHPARRAELPRSVEFMGPIASDELRRLYQSADAFVFPSMFEGFGLVILEAMACGLPVIGTDATAATDIVDDTNGWVLPSGNLDALVVTLRGIAEHRDRLLAMRRSARKRAEQFSWERYRASVNRAVEGYV